jgi:hypothetical protein
MSYLELLPNLASQILCTHPIEFGFAKSAKKVIDRLVVGYMKRIVVGRQKPPPSQVAVRRVMLYLT